MNAVSPNLAAEDVMEAAGLRLRIGARKVATATGAQVSLTWMETSIMVALMRRAPGAATHDAIIRAMYGAREEPDSAEQNIHVFIMHMRRKFAAVQAPVRIRSVYRLGYVLEELAA